MYRRIDDFLTAWQHETETTHKVLAELTDESLGFVAVEGVRSIGKLAWHIVQALVEMPTSAGLTVPHADTLESPPPATARAFVDAYDARAAAVASVVRDAWTDEMLDERIPMYGESWSRGVTLGILVAHQAHHRGQLTVLMRLAGLKVPGCYGPAREEWALYGMQPQD